MKNDKFIEDGIKFILSLFSKPEAAPAPAPVQEAPVVPKISPDVVCVTTTDLGPGWHEVNWDNPKCKISKYFTVEEAIYLREWKRLANASDGLDDKVKQNLYGIFQKMDQIRELLQKPIYVKSAYRPPAYNVAIGGAAKSAHMATEDYGAVDFWTDQNGDGTKDGKDCDDIKAILMPKLEGLGLRMEDNGAGARWVHLDNKPVAPGGHRFFKP